MRDTNKSKIKNGGILEWMSPFGVITTGEFILRLIILVMIMLAPIALIAVGYEQPSEAVAIASMGLMFVVPVALWMVLTTVTKQYRTKGVFAPFFFALFTPILPVMFFLTWFFSSRENRETNQALAKLQREHRTNRAAKKPRTTIKVSTQPEKRTVLDDKAGKTALRVSVKKTPSRNKKQSDPTPTVQRMR
ncbi:hypothetical protein GCM10008927_13110 [Amylibacter ulvae]|uniref:Inner membrane protein n=1 Tax=Paramylibacter ulvae TaxID=1651968 RepID=A0ABQ3D002_9RHOB|nr:hypothetical protein [Amylibacter ulvae]GHA49307.1 hypothetical protein GCM10008927_13110 [Amylibacter ulvae]